MITSEKHQKALLGGVERFVGFSHPDLVSAVPKILMAFYQVDLIEEEVVKQWGTHVSKKYVDKDTSKKVRKASEPFLKVSICPFLALLLSIAKTWSCESSGSTRPRMMTPKRRIKMSEPFQ